jgi:acyl-CoA synthetase (AMP-forming)/AMP-acid ligase II
VITEECVLSWADVERRSRCLARALDGSGLGEGQVWGVLARNRVEWAEFGLGNVRAGTRVEQVKAVIETAGEVDLDDVGRFAADRLAWYKLPKSYDIVDRLPREAHGKLKKRLLRDPYWVGER